METNYRQLRDKKCHSDVSGFAKSLITRNMWVPLLSGDVERKEAAVLTFRRNPISD
jgi:hypothetical protein